MSIIRTLRTLALAMPMALAATGASAGDTPLAVGSPAPPLELHAAGGGVRSLAGVGHPVIVVFFRGVW